MTTAAERKKRIARMSPPIRVPSPVNLFYRNERMEAIDAVGGEWGSMRRGRFVAGCGGASNPSTT